MTTSETAVISSHLDADERSKIIQRARAHGPNTANIATPGIYVLEFVMAPETAKFTPYQYDTTRKGAQILLTELNETEIVSLTGASSEDLRYTLSL